jgi:MFS family permease
MTEEDKDNSKPCTGLAFWAPLVAAAMAMFIVVVDSTMMNVAVPTIVKDLKTNVSTVQGIISLYSLVMASLMLIGAKLGAMRGKASQRRSGRNFIASYRPTSGSRLINYWTGRL